MLFYAVAGLSSAYTVLAIVLLITYFYLKHAYGIEGSTEKINKLARTKKIAVFEIYSYLSLIIWLVLVIPWVDLITFRYFSHFNEGGITTYFGWMTGKQADLYFVLIFANIIGAKAAMTLAELAGMLRRGRVRMVPHGLFFVWISE